MRFLLLLALLNTTGVESSPNTLAPHLLKLNPKVANAEVLGKLITKYSVKYHLDPLIVTAIFKQESNFNFKAVNKHSFDYGIGQLNHRTIKSRKLDINKILNDPDYAIEQTCVILSELRDKYAIIDTKHGRKFYTRYHSFTHARRYIYRNLLDKHLHVLKGSYDVNSQRRS